MDRSDGGAEGAGGFFADMGDIVSSAQRAGGNLAGRIELDVGSEVVGVVDWVAVCKSMLDGKFVGGGVNLAEVVWVLARSFNE